MKYNSINEITKVSTKIKNYLLENNVYLLSDIDDNIDNIDISTKSVNNLLDGSVAI
jgi:hypothetical protein